MPITYPHTFTQFVTDYSPSEFTYAGVVAYSSTCRGRFSGHIAVPYTARHESGRLIAQRIEQSLVLIEHTINRQVYSLILDHAYGRSNRISLDNELLPYLECIIDNVRRIPFCCTTIEQVHKAVHIDRAPIICLLDHADPIYDPAVLAQRPMNLIMQYLVGPKGRLP